MVENVKAILEKKLLKNLVENLKAILVNELSLFVLLRQLYF